MSEDPIGPEEAGDLYTEPQLFVADGLVRLSFSSIDTYLNCPAKFRYGYVFRIPTEEVATPLVFGSAVHDVLERCHEGDRTSLPTPEELKQWLREAWEAQPFDQLDEAQNNHLKRRAWSVCTSYLERVRDSWRPAAGTELWFEVPFGLPAQDGGTVEHEAMVVGSIDRLDIDPDGAMHVVDYKTNKKVKSRQRIGTDLQLSIYALAVEHLFGRLPATVALEFVVPGEVVRVPVADLDLDDARRKVVETARAVKAEAFDPTPNPLCDWCDFKAICPSWEADDGPSLGQAEAEVRALRREARGLLKVLAEKEASLASLSRSVAARATEQADGLAIEAQERAEARRARREAEAQERAAAGATPDPDAGPTLDLEQLEAVPGAENAPR